MGSRGARHLQSSGKTSACVGLCDFVSRPVWQGLAVTPAGKGPKDWGANQVSLLFRHMSQLGLREHLGLLSFGRRSFQERCYWPYFNLGRWGPEQFVCIEQIDITLFIFRGGGAGHADDISFRKGAEQHQQSAVWGLWSCACVSYVEGRQLEPQINKIIELSLSSV